MRIGLLGQGICGIMVQSIMMPAAMVLFEPLADVININWLFLGSGAVLFTLGFFILGSRVLRTAGE